METTTRPTLHEMIRSIEKQATAGFMHYNPVTVVTCPHCGGRMQAMDAKKHARNADHGYEAPFIGFGPCLRCGGLRTQHDDQRGRE